MCAQPERAHVDISVDSIDFMSFLLDYNPILHTLSVPLLANLQVRHSRSLNPARHHPKKTTAPQRSPPPCRVACRAAGPHPVFLSNNR